MKSHVEIASESSGMQFDSLAQQSEANTLGMWVFIATEVLFFGALFLIYTVYRWFHGQAFIDASGDLNLKISSINTVLLLTSSMTIAVAEKMSMQAINKSKVCWLIVATIVLGLIFLLLKSYEYHEEFHNGLIPFVNDVFDWDKPDIKGAALFFNLYFVMTGLHAVHLVIGCILMTFFLTSFLRHGVNNFQRIRIAALYWHFVDIVWIWLFPLFYLVR